MSPLARHLLEVLEDAPGSPFLVVTGFYAYHTTFLANLDDIQEDGLLVDMEANEGNFKHGAVFFADYEQCLSIKQQAEDSDQPAAILALWIPEGSTVYGDDNMPGGSSYCIAQDIPVENISIVDEEDHHHGPDFSKHLRPI